MARLTRGIFVLAYRLIHIPRLTSLPRRSSDIVAVGSSGARVSASARISASQKFPVADHPGGCGASATAKRYTAVAKRILITRRRNSYLRCLFLRQNGEHARVLDGRLDKWIRQIRSITRLKSSVAARHVLLHRESVALAIESFASGVSGERTVPIRPA